MKQESKKQVLKTIQQFNIPEYESIPDVGLYLEQVANYINQYFAIIPDMEITTSMISNYVKKGLVDRSIKKKYYRDQIAKLIFISMAKTVLSIDRLKLLFQLQEQSYDIPTAYEYLRLELNNVLSYVFGFKNEIDQIGVTHTDEKEMLRNTITAFAHRMYLELSLEAISQEEK